MSGVAFVVGEPEKRQAQVWQGQRWPWWIPTRTEVFVWNLEDAPTRVQAGLEEVRFAPGSYLELTRQQFEDAARALRAIGDRVG